MSTTNISNITSTSTITQEIKRNIVKELYKVGCFKTGTFTLNSGKTSDFYIDLRDLTHYPKLLNNVAGLIANKIKQCYSHLDNIDQYLIAGIPSGAIPLATLVSQHLGVKMLMVRKKPKDHGTKQQIEALDKLEDKGAKYNCLFIDDIVTSGKSIRWMFDIFENNTNISVTGAFVFLDREDDTKCTNIKCTSVFTLSEVKHILKECGVTFIERKQIRKTFTERAELTKNTSAKRLFQIMDKKKTNLIVSIDVCDINQAYSIINEVKDSVCAVKLHYDIFNNNTEIWKQYKQMIENLAVKHYFLIFEDRKFSDIGFTVQKQLQHVIRAYASLDLITVLPIFGEGTINALTEKENTSNIGIMIVAEGSSANNLFNSEFSKECVKMGKTHANNVSGFICQKRVSTNDSFVYATPGVHLSSSTDNSNQKYRSIDKAIIDDDCDVIIVGRGITNSENIKQTAEMYAKKAYQNYLFKIHTK